MIVHHLFSILTKWCQINTVSKRNKLNITIFQQKYSVLHKTVLMKSLWDSATDLNRSGISLNHKITVVEVSWDLWKSCGPIFAQAKMPRAGCPGLSKRKFHSLSRQHMPALCHLHTVFPLLRKDFTHSDHTNTSKLLLTTHWTDQSRSFAAPLVPFT